MVNIFHNFHPTMFVILLAVILSNGLIGRGRAGPIFTEHTSNGVDNDNNIYNEDTESVRVDDLAGAAESSAAELTDTGAPGAEMTTSSPPDETATKYSQLFQFTVPDELVAGLPVGEGEHVITESIDEFGNMYHFDAVITVGDLHPPPECDMSDLVGIRQLTQNITTQMSASLQEMNVVKTGLRYQTERVRDLENTINRLEDENTDIRIQISDTGDGLSTVRTDVQAAVTLIQMMNDTIRAESSALSREIIDHLSLDTLTRRDDDVDMMKIQTSVIAEQTEALNETIRDVIGMLNVVGGEVTGRMAAILESQLLLMHRQFDRLSNQTRNYITKAQEEESFYHDCSDIKLHEPNLESGVYTIRARYSKEVFNVYCDMDSNGGGWTIIQNRFDGREDFARNWMQYKYGFGDLNSEFWLGNEKIYLLTNQDNYTLHIELTNFDLEVRYAIYDWAYIDGSDQQYRLHLGSYRGDAGDSLAYHDGKKFSTWDQDHDPASSVHSSIRYGGFGGWWQGYGDLADLNGVYRTDISRDLIDGNIEWAGLGRFLVYYIKATTMKIKPRSLVRPYVGQRP